MTKPWTSQPSRWTKDVERFLVGDLFLSDKDVILIRESLYPQLNSGDHDNLYRMFTINDRGRRSRKICAPVRDLKRIQRLLMWRFWYRMRPNSHVHGFVKGCSPVTNAREHAGLSKDDQVLTCDVRNFFSSIPFIRVRSAAYFVLNRRFSSGSKNSYKDIADVIATLSCWKNRLATGSPSSPAISNIVLAKFDAQIIRAVKSKYRSCTYTRYADDITISGRDVHRHGAVIIRELHRLGLQLHPKKTRIMRHHRQQNVTGVVVNTGQPTISRKVRRKLRAQLHHKELIIEKVERGTKDPFFTLSTKDTPMDELVGMASWIASVSPSETHQRLLVKARELQARERRVRTSPVGSS